MTAPNEIQETFNVYCDESCHLPNDRQGIMAFGAVWCPKAKAKELASALRAIQARYNARGELKWSKISASRRDFYLALVDWFLQEPDLHYRGVVVRNKQALDHDAFNEGDHDLFYYKMQFSLLSKILSPDKRYAIYLDIKDTLSRQRLKKLNEVLCNNVYDFTHEMVAHMQNAHSSEMALMQLADYFTGALSYRHRNLGGNAAKLAVVEHLESRLQRSLLASTALNEQKFNVFVWNPRGSSQA